MNPKGLPALQTPTDPSKPLAQASCPPVSLSLSCLAPALEFHNTDGLAGKGNLGLVDSSALESSNIVGGVDFVRAVGHANCPGILGFKARGDTERWGAGRWGGKATSHVDQIINPQGDTPSSTCSLSTRTSRRNPPSLFPGGCILWSLVDLAVDWSPVGQDRANHILLENSMVGAQLKGAWEGSSSGVRVRLQPRFRHRALIWDQDKGSEWIIRVKDSRDLGLE